MTIKQKATLVVLGLVLVSILAGLAYYVFFSPAPAEQVSEQPKIEDIVATQMAALPTQTPSKAPTATAQPTTVPPTPTAIPDISGYKIRGKVDLDNGSPVTLTIYKKDGEMIVSRWASAISYHDGESPDVFATDKGTVYSHIENGGYLTTEAHSGALRSKGPLFAYPLEKSVWMNPDGTLMTLDKGKEATASLIGARVVLCQASAEANIAPFASFDPSQPCPGVSMQFTITAAALIERENVDAYKASQGNIIPWLIKNKPGTGFETLKPDTAYLIQSCVGQYNDQISDGTASYVFNRIALGMTLDK